MAEEYIKVKDLSQELRDGIVERLKSHTVVLYLSENSQLQLYGTGVLVSLGDVFGVLTAFHVIQRWMDLSTCDRLGILLENDTNAEGVERHKLHSTKIAFTEGPIGPDIGFVVFSHDVVGAVRSRKVFYDLEKYRESVLAESSEINEGVWVCLGAIDEKTKKDATTGKTIFHCDGLFGGPETAGVVDGFDYFHYPNQSENNPVKSWGGLSGSGLWKVPLKRSSESGTLDIDFDPPMLSGIAFREFRDGDRMSIRCHGPKSIYEKVYAHFGA